MTAKQTGANAPTPRAEAMPEEPEVIKKLRRLPDGVIYATEHEVVAHYDALRAFALSRIAALEARERELEAALREARDKALEEATTMTAKQTGAKCYWCGRGGAYFRPAAPNAPAQPQTGEEGK